MVKWKKLLTVILVIGILTGAGASVISIEAGLLDDSDVEVSADLAINSNYMWRGFKLDDDPVIQPGIYVSACGFTASIWGSFDIDADDSLNSDEMDYCIDYTYSFDTVSLSIGHTYYDFPAGDCASKEFYLGAGLDVFLSPALTWYHDYADEDSGGGDGDYVVLDLSHSLPLGESSVTCDLAGHIGYNNELFIAGNGGDIGLSAGLTFPLTDKCSFSPNVNYSIPFGDLEDSDDGNQDDEFYAGVILTFSM